MGDWWLAEAIAARAIRRPQQLRRLRRSMGTPHQGTARARPRSRLHPRMPPPKAIDHHASPPAAAPQTPRRCARWRRGSGRCRAAGPPGSRRSHSGRSAGEGEGRGRRGLNARRRVVEGGGMFREGWAARPRVQRTATQAAEPTPSAAQPASKTLRGVPAASASGPPGWRSRAAPPRPPPAGRAHARQGGMLPLLQCLHTTCSPAARPRRAPAHASAPAPSPARRPGPACMARQGQLLIFFTHLHLGQLPLARLLEAPLLRQLGLQLAHLGGDKGERVQRRGRAGVCEWRREGVSRCSAEQYRAELTQAAAACTAEQRR